MTQRMHPLIADYAARHGIVAPEPFRGRMTVVVDEIYRIHLQETQAGQCALLSRLASMPPAGGDRDAWLLTMGRLAVATLSSLPAACVIDSRETALWLQQIVTAGGGDAVDEAMGQFVNALSFWTGALRRLA